MIPPTILISKKEEGKEYRTLQFHTDCLVVLPEEIAVEVWKRYNAYDDLLTALKEQLPLCRPRKGVCGKFGVHKFYDMDGEQYLCEEHSEGHNFYENYGGVDTSKFAAIALIKQAEAGNGK